jgi:chromosomal replication initiator protein
MEATQRLWGQVLSRLSDQIESPQTFETWFRPIVPLTLCPELVELEVPNPFFVDWLHEHHLPLLRRTIAEVLASNPEIRFAPRDPQESTASMTGRPAASNGAATVPPHAQASLESPRPDRTWFDGHLNPRHTFESFVVGGSNRLAHAACRAVVEKPAEAYNPLFIFGGSGLGKTHLLHAIGHAVRVARRDARVCYVPAERFTNELIYAIQHAQTLAFRNKYRSVDVLLIDDIQFLAGKESTLEEFFYTFNALRDAHKQVVVTADKPPKDILQIEQRLVSRFNQGLITDVQQPDLETRLAILHNRCEREGPGVHLPEDVLLLIADRIRNNVRDLEGCLVRVLALGSLLHQEITLPLAEEVLQHYVNPEPEQFTPERILAVVAERYGVRAEALCGQRRTHSIVLPRQVAMYLMRQFTELSFVEIGRAFGGRDHSTVMYSCAKVTELMEQDKSFSERLNAIVSTLESA